MKLFLFTILVEVLLAIPARADWTANADGSWTFRAEAADCTCGDACQCAPGECPGKCPVSQVKAEPAAAPAGRWVQVCDGNSCRMMWVPASDAASPTAPVEASGDCASCASCGSAAASSGSARRTGPLRRVFGRLFRGGCCN